MASIPLPALAVQPPRNPIDEYARAVQLQGEMQQNQQRQAMAPLQQQEAQNQVQQSQISTQQAALDLQDRQSISNALMESYG